MEKAAVRKIPLEVAVFSPESALVAQEHGASRVELNARRSYAAGGLTPSLADIRLLRTEPRKLAIPLRLMIRPRGPPLESSRPDFVYSAQELADMIASIHQFKESGLLCPDDGDGFVFGAVKVMDNGEPGKMNDVGGTCIGTGIDIDDTVCNVLVEASKPFHCVFHRAFDPIAAAGRAVEGARKLRALGFDTLLTAGGVDGGCCQRDNLDTIDHLCHHLSGALTVVAGGGLRCHNLGRATKLLTTYGAEAVWFHTAAVKVADDVVTEELDTEELDNLIAILRQTHQP
ncbi:hypothetical protein RJ55_05768 [Drechmeria coniospora]|nr:hypothetical protein RJ55_05768 [Drechmeria coniospora]